MFSYKFILTNIRLNCTLFVCGYYYTLSPALCTYCGKLIFIALLIALMYCICFPLLTLCHPFDSKRVAPKLPTRSYLRHNVTDDYTTCAVAAEHPCRTKVILAFFELRAKIVLANDSAQAP